MICVDTSVLIDLFKGRKTKEVEHIIYLEKEGTNFCIPAVCAQETLQGAKSNKEWDLLLNYLSTQYLISTSKQIEHHLAAAKINFDCHKKGLTINSTVDSCIAQLCLENDLRLLTSDKDFQKIAKVRPLKFAIL